MGEHDPSRQSKFALGLNFRLLQEQIYLYPRTSLRVVVATLFIGFVALIVMPPYPNGWRPNLLECVMYLFFLVVALVVAKLSFTLALHRRRTGTAYPGSLIVASAMFMALVFSVIYPGLFWIMVRSRDIDVPIHALLILATVGYPLFTFGFWIYLLLQNTIAGPWPSWLPRE